MQFVPNPIPFAKKTPRLAVLGLSATTLWVVMIYAEPPSQP